MDSLISSRWIPNRQLLYRKGQIFDRSTRFCLWLRWRIGCHWCFYRRLALRWHPYGNEATRHFHLRKVHLLSVFNQDHFPHRRWIYLLFRPLQHLYRHPQYRSLEPLYEFWSLYNIIGHFSLQCKEHGSFRMCGADLSWIAQIRLSRAIFVPLSYYQNQFKSHNSIEDFLGQMPGACLSYNDFSTFWHLSFSHHICHQRWIKKT